MRALREPLLHFLLMGATMFGLDHALGQRAASEPSPIVVDAELRASLAERWAATHDAPPTPEQLEAAVADWKDQELLYRAGVARGLDRDDPRVRERVASKMAFVIRDSIVLPEPSEQELRAWYDQQAERWARAELVDFTHVFVSSDGAEAQLRASDLLRQLQAGADPAGLGDTFSGGRRYRKRKLVDLGQTFGEEFVAGMDSQVEATWVMRRSRFGLHLVRIDRRTPAASGSFEAARLDVQKDWEVAQRQAAFDKAMEELRARWRIIDEP